MAYKYGAPPADCRATGDSACHSRTVEIFQCVVPGTPHVYISSAPSCDYGYYGTAVVSTSLGFVHTRPFLNAVALYQERNWQTDERLTVAQSGVGSLNAPADPMSSITSVIVGYMLAPNASPAPGTRLLTGVDLGLSSGEAVGRVHVNGPSLAESEPCGQIKLNASEVVPLLEPSLVFVAVCLRGSVARLSLAISATDFPRTCAVLAACSSGPRVGGVHVTSVCAQRRPQRH
jgi:hypothetical protein